MSSVFLAVTMLGVACTGAAASQRVARLECAPASETTEDGGLGSVDHCRIVVNGCDVPVELRVDDQATRVGHGTGLIEVNATGKVCTSHPNAIAYYTLYGPSRRPSQRGVTGEGSYSATVGRSWRNAGGQTSSDTQDFTVQVAGGTVAVSGAAFSATVPAGGSGGGTYNGLPLQCRAGTSASRVSVDCTNVDRGQTTTWAYVVHLRDGRCVGASMDQESRSDHGFGRWTTTGSRCH